MGGLTGTAGKKYWDVDSLGTYSFASGLNTRAKGLASTAIGRNGIASGNYSLAAGYLTEARAAYSSAFGVFTDALANGSTAFGYSSKTNGNYSIAGGYFSQTNGSYSMAMGHSVEASGTGSFATGVKTLAQGYASAAFGRYNVGGGTATGWISTEPLFEVGYGTSTSNRKNAFTILKNGNIGVKFHDPQDALHVNGRIRLAGTEYFEDGGANKIRSNANLEPVLNNFYDLGSPTRKWRDLYAANGTIITSDRREKENIEELNYGLDEIMALRPVRFNWKTRPGDGTKIGLIAQEVQQVMGEIVKTHTWVSTEDGKEPDTLVEMPVMGMYIADIIPVLVKGMQEQQTEIETLKAELQAQKILIEALMQKGN